MMEYFESLIEFKSDPDEFKMITSDSFDASIFAIEFCLKSKNIQNKDEEPKTGCGCEKL